MATLVYRKSGRWAIRLPTIPRPLWRVLCPLSARRSAVMRAKNRPLYFERERRSLRHPAPTLSNRHCFPLPRSRLPRHFHSRPAPHVALSAVAQKTKRRVSLPFFLSFPTLARISATAEADAKACARTRARRQTPTRHKRWTRLHREKARQIT